MEQHPVRPQKRSFEDGQAGKSGLPGHSPCVALLDEASGVFFAGDAIYDDELLDDMECSDRVAYRATMRRLLDEIEISKGYGGHGPSFDQARMHEIARGYLERTGGP